MPDDAAILENDIAALRKIIDSAPLNANRKLIGAFSEILADRRRRLAQIKLRDVRVPRAA